jgi:hypothetical protein
MYVLIVQTGAESAMCIDAWLNGSNCIRRRAMLMEQRLILKP